MPDATSRSVADWVLQEKIGRGSFAVVWKAIHAKTGHCVAVKEISTDRLNKKLKQSLESEVSILKQIRHQNIVRLEDVVEESSCLYLFMEFCAGGDLAGYIHRCKRVPEVTACAVMRQLGAGLQELWSRHMVHRDLKPQNLLLSDHTPQAVLKIADFGFARHLQQHQLADTLCGSPLYMAPEILQSHKYDAKADLWSVGTILYELVVGRPPFNGSNHVALLHNIERNEAKIPDHIARNLSAACVDLIYSLLKRDPVQRISFEEFFNHPFLAATTPLAPSVPGEVPVSDTHASGMQRPVQRIAGKAATGSEQDLPFVLDDDAVAPVFDERVQDQQAAHPHDDDDDDAAQMQALRPRYGHRSPASALAGRQFVQATSKQRPPLGASPRPSTLAAAAKPPSIPSTPPIAAGPLPGATSSHVQGRAVMNHPLQPVRGASSMGSSMEEDGFVIVNPPSPSSSGHQPISRRASAGWQGTLLTRLRSESLPRHFQHQQPQPQQRTQRDAPTVPTSVPQQQQQAQLPLHHQQAAAAPSHTAAATSYATHTHPGKAVGQAQPEVAVLHPAPVIVRAVDEPEAEPEMGSSQALLGTAHLLEELAVEHEGRHQLQHGIALRLLAMQLLLAAFRRDSTACPGDPPDVGPDPTLQQQQQQQRNQAEGVDAQKEGSQGQQDEEQQPAFGGPEQVTTPAQFRVVSKQVKQQLSDAVSRVEDSLSALQQEGESTAVPYVWQVVYQAALAYAQAGATQEIIGGIGSCLPAYSQVCRQTCQLSWPKCASLNCGSIWELDLQLLKACSLPQSLLF
ncbi:hypothetical protein ABBQ38_013792 [Trebouxia sp. C0009 RCD-2024]